MGSVMFLIMFNNIREINCSFPFIFLSVGMCGFNRTRKTIVLFVLIVVGFACYGTSAGSLYNNKNTQLSAVVLVQL